MARKSSQSAKSNNAQAGEKKVPLKETSNRGKASKQKADARPAKGSRHDEQFADGFAERRHILDERTRRDITGIVIGVIAVILFVLAVAAPSGLITTVASDFLHNLLGMGAYVLPFMLVVIGASFLIRTEKEHVAFRVTLGSVMMFVSILALLALFVPGASEAPSLLWGHDALVLRGGMVGSAIAWVFLSLFGIIVSAVILVGVTLGGAVVIGFSISGVIEKAREKSEEIRQHREERREEAEEQTALQSPAYMDVQPSPKIRRNVIPDVPRDLSRPRRASRSLTTQLLESSGADSLRIGPGEDVLSGPDAHDVGMYWPEEYAFEGQTVKLPLDAEADDASEEAPASITRKLKRKKDSESTDTGKAGGSTKRKNADKAASVAGGNLDAAPTEVRDGFALPPMEYLKRTVHNAANRATDKELRETALLLQDTLADFSIMAGVVGWVAGPTVTLFKVDLPSGVRVSRITALQDDIALALAAPGVRIFAPIPGTNYVGIEVPNKKRENVLLGDILPEAHGAPLEMAIGKDVEGHAIITDLAKMPHLLIGGTTGSGKSVAINSMIMSILMRSTPDEVRFIMIDPKRVEFTPYNGIPHLYVPVVTENKEAASALAWGVAEMERRLKVLSKHAVRNISQYNAKVESGELDGEESDEPAKKMPYIVIVIDELADLMMNVGKEVEFSISRIAQLARAAGIHLIVATQRPSTNVVTGLIKANITNRIAFNVASGIDSRVILDTPGAENLIGLGDMLFSKPEYAKPQRLQGCFVSEDEIEAVVEFLKSQGEPEYHQEILKTNLITQGASQPDGSGGSCTSDDPLLWDAAEIVVSSGLGSTSNIQRRLSVGYSRAGRIMDMLEEKGIVGPPNGSKPREVLVSDVMELETLKAFEAHDDDSCPF